MPTLYLSPSTQEGNPVVIGNSEEYYMNLIADAMEPYLISNGITFSRNDRNASLGQAIRESNAGNYDLHLALHSNAAPPANAGNVQGADFYYYATSAPSREAATILAENYKRIYPYPEKSRPLATTSLAELRQTRAPAVLAELAYHDNVEEATWISNNIEGIARNLTEGLTEYFSIPFVEARVPVPGTVRVTSGGLNLRDRPNTQANVLRVIPNGATVTVNGQWDNWYVVTYDGTTGYANAAYIAV